MKRFYDKALIETHLKQTKFESVMSGLRKYLFVAQYEKGEFVTMPLQKEHLFQIIIQGSVSIYFIRDDGSVYSLSNSRKDDLLGEMEIFPHQPSNVYAESKNDVICLALSIETSKDALLGNCQFLQMICESLTKKMESITTIDAAPASLKQRVLTYMRYKCCKGELKGLQQTAFHLNCSTRQLQRILNQYESDGTVVKTGKGAYKLTSSSSF
ncbi:MAG: cyclic nucleotide-binding domain-containing protein [Lachnospiraceae bacterium]|nr:cyclic nucleotide-binding domain-containing protein [Lachnospiraceae bacterium]MCI9577075.1 cyclic nucleotide-binding domain-containing protein [Clostridiales bacterium]